MSKKKQKHIRINRIGFRYNGFGSKTKKVKVKYTPQYLSQISSELIYIDE